MEIDRRTFVTMSALAGTALGGMGLGHFPRAWAQDAKGLREMRASIGSPILVSSICFLWLGMHEKLGYYRQEGLTAEWKGVQSQTQALGLLSNMSQEVGGVGASTLMGLAAKGTRLPLKVAYAHYQRNPFRAVVRADDKVAGWGDLKGGKIGLLSLGQLSTKWYAEAAAREAGLNPATDISFIPIGTNAPAGVALENKAADVYISHISHTERLIRLGFKVRYLPEPKFAGLNSFDGGMTVNSEFLSKPDNRKALVGFMRAIAKGTVFSLENPVAATELHYDMFRASLPKGIPYEDAVKAAVVEFRGVLENVAVDKTDHKKHGMMSKQKWETVAYELMQLSHQQIPDVGEFYTNDLIAEVNAFDAEAVKQQARNFRMS